MASSSRSWCVACTFVLGKCTQECVFAPYCPPEDPLKFLMVHKVFEASNFAKVLNDLPAQERKDAVISLACAAISRLKDPQSAYDAAISVLQQHLRHIQNEILYLRKELSTHIGPASAAALLPHNSDGGGAGGGGGVGGGTPFGIPSTQMLLQQNQQQALHNQHIAAAISYYKQEEIWNSMFGMDGGRAGRSVMAVVHGLCNMMRMMDNNSFGLQLAESDHQNPQVSLAAAGASSVHHHHLSLQQQLL